MAAFWSDATSHPMRNYRWKLTINGFGDEHNVVWWAKTVSVPSFDISEATHDYFDNKFYFPGRVTWSDVEVTLVDPVSPSAVELTHKIIEAAGYNIASGPADKKTISKEKSVSDGLKQVKLELLDVEGVSKEEWVLKNAWIKAAKFGDLDYTNDDLRQVSLTIKYDWATCKISGTEYYKKN